MWTHTKQRQPVEATYRDDAVAASPVNDFLRALSAALIMASVNGALVLKKLIFFSALCLISLLSSSQGSSSFSCSHFFIFYSCLASVLLCLSLPRSLCFYMFWV